MKTKEQLIEAALKITRKTGPKHQIDDETYNIISAMRDKNISYSSIFQVLKEDKRITYKSWHSFRMGWITRHKVLDSQKKTV